MPFSSLFYISELALDNIIYIKIHLLIFDVW